MDDPRFERVLAAEAVSNFGSMLSRLAIPFLAALQLQATTAQMALLLVADVAAAGSGALLLGAWVDARSRRALMLACDAMRALLFAGLAALAWRGMLTMGLLVTASAAAGLLTVAFEMARSAWTAQCVPVRELPRRNAQLQMAGSVSEALAFAAGGWLFQALGAVVALLVDGLSYLASALCLRGVREVPGTRPEPHDESRGETSWQAACRDAGAAAAAGLRAVAAAPRLRALCAVHALLSLAMALFGTAMIVYVTRDLGLATGPLGVIFATGALGSLGGAALAPWVGRRFGPGRTMGFGLALFALGLACVPLAQGAGWPAMALLLAQQLVGDAGHVMHAVHDQTLRQRAAPPALLARVDAGIRGAGHAATLLGAWIGALLGTAAGARSVLWAGVACAAAAAGWAALRLAERGTRR